MFSFEFKIEVQAPKTAIRGLANIKPATSGEIYMQACKVRENVCIERQMVKGPEYGGMNRRL